jgi:hypothetical protein
MVGTNVSVIPKSSSFFARHFVAKRQASRDWLPKPLDDTSLETLSRYGWASMDI